MIFYSSDQKAGGGGWKLPRAGDVGALRAAKGTSQPSSVYQMASPERWGSSAQVLTSR